MRNRTSVCGCSALMRRYCCIIGEWRESAAGSGSAVDVVSVMAPRMLELRPAPAALAAAVNAWRVGDGPQRPSARASAPATVSSSCACSSGYIGSDRQRRQTSSTTGSGAAGAYAASAGWR